MSLLLLSWMLRTNQGSLKLNPCMRASGVRRNSETVRERYVTHEEYQVVYDASTRSVRLMMELVYRTLQRPEVDVLAWTPANVQHKGSEKVLRFVQSKTGRRIDIALVSQLQLLVDQAIGLVPVLHQPIVHNLKGKAFRDLKGKGATDMWLAGLPIERIQLLCGHKTKSTTEKYIKARWTETATPNTLEVGR
jgi:integrase